MEHWIQKCKDDVGLGFQELNVVCLVGMGQYSRYIAASACLDGYDKDPSIGLLKYIVDGRSGEWKVYSDLSYGVIFSATT